MSEVTELETDIHRLQEELKAKQARLEYIRRNCSHLWNETTYEPIQTEATAKVASQTIRQWKRFCKNCHISQITQHIKKMQVSGHIAGTTSEMEMPEF